MRQTYIFKKVEDSRDLRQLFQLRYSVFSNCHMKLFIRPNKSKLDISAFDTRAVQYGLYTNDTLIGCIRVVMPEGTEENPAILALKEEINEHPMPPAHGQTATAAYPFLDYGRDITDHWKFYELSRQKKEKVVEGGRLALLPEFRNIRVSKLLIESVFAHYFILEENARQAVVSSTIDHAPFYRHYGFKAIGPESGYPTLGNQMVTFSIPIGTLSAVPHHLHDRFYQLANQYSSTGQIVCQI